MPRLTELLVYRQFRRNWRDYGLGVALLKVCQHPFAQIYVSRSYRIYGIDPCAYPYQPTPPPDDQLEYSFIGPEEHDLMIQIEEIEEWLDGDVEQRLRKGALCLVAFDGRRVVGFNMVSFGRVRIPLIGVEWVIGPYHAWSEQISVIPGYRTLGVASRLRYRMFTELRKRGIAHFYGGILAINTGSRRLAQKVGFKDILEVHCRKVLDHSIRRYT